MKKAIIAVYVCGWLLAGAALGTALYESVRYDTWTYCIPYEHNGKYYLTQRGIDAPLEKRPSREISEEDYRAIRKNEETGKWLMGAALALIFPATIGLIRLKKQADARKREAARAGPTEPQRDIDGYRTDD